MTKEQFDEIASTYGSMTPEELEGRMRAAGVKFDEPAPDPLSALQSALDDGQEVKMHRFWNPQTQQSEYLVRIFGDCHLEQTLAL